MGEIADMMLDGTLDCMTGEYIGKPCGYPRSLSGGGNPRPQYKKQRPQYSEARNDIHSLCGCYGIHGADVCQLVGVFLSSVGVNPLPKMNRQYKILRGQYRNQFVQYLKNLKK